VYAYHGWLRLDAKNYSADSNTHNRRVEKGGKISKLPHTAALMYMNIFDRWPGEMMEVFHGDTFLRRRLELHGDGAFIPNINPNVRRVHSGGIRESLSAFMKHLRVFQSNAKMMKFFTGTDKEAERREFAIEYFCKMLECVDDQISLREKYYHIFKCAGIIVKYQLTWNTMKKMPLSIKRLARYRVSRVVRALSA
jgi:hypothetical protein